MSISSSEVTTSATLEQFRVEFNNLVSDVTGLESGAASFSNIEIKEDGGLLLSVQQMITLKLLSQ